MRLYNYLNEGHRAPRINWNLPAQELAIALINRYGIHDAHPAIKAKIKPLEKSFLPENRKKLEVYKAALKIISDKGREELAKMKRLHETNDADDEHMRAEIKTLQAQIKHVSSLDPKSSQLKWLRKQLRDLRMQLKGLD